jgi:DNA circularisation protein N-terminus
MPQVPSRVPNMITAQTMLALAVSGRPPVVVGSQLVNQQKTVGWRTRFRLAQFKSVPFYVDQQGRSSGRRTVVFEYPKRDLPFAEDMGRHVLRYQMTGYLIQAPTSQNGTSVGALYNGMQRDYDQARDLLEAALLSPGPGILVDPYNPRLYSNGSLSGYTSSQPIMFMCERYSIVEQRDKGGFCSVEMSFVESGIPGNQLPDQASTQALQALIANALLAAANNMNQTQQQANQIPD